MIAAPASRQASASAISSSVEIGTFGLRRLLVAPLIAASMITGVATRQVSPDRPAFDQPGGVGYGRRCRHRGTSAEEWP